MPVVNQNTFLFSINNIYDNLCSGGKIMKKYFKLISVLLAFFLVASSLVSCSSEHHATTETEEIVLPEKGDGDYNGTISDGSTTFWISVWINAWDKYKNDGTCEKGSFYYVVFKSSEKTKSNIVVKALCSKDNSRYIEVTSGYLKCDEFQARSQDDGKTYNLELTLIKESTNEKVKFTGTLRKKSS